MNDTQTPGGAASRRDFLKTTAAGTVLAAGIGLAPHVGAAETKSIRVGVIGCGGRGSGAVDDVLHADKDVKLVAMADAFEDRLKSCLKSATKRHGDRIDVPASRQFVGLDAFEKLVACDEVNYVMLATPPGFRPLHLQAAIAAGKNIFTEKPAGVDSGGIRKVLAAYEEAKKKNLCIAAGTQRRHQRCYLETMQRVHDGAIGELTGARAYWVGGYVWDPSPRRAGQSDVDFQVRNWYYYVWLCGDHIVEQHVHNLDVINWALKSHPIRCAALGGRTVRTDPKYGQIYDHFAVDYEYPHPSGDPKKPTIHVMSLCRQLPGGFGYRNVSEGLVGSKGTCDLNDNGNCVLYGLDGSRTWAYNGRKRDDLPYVQEHRDLIECIRTGKPINELQNVAHSTLTAIMGRMSAYSGERITWDQALRGPEDLMPEKLTWDTSLPEWTVPVPGRTKLIAAR